MVDDGERNARNETLHIENRLIILLKTIYIFPPKKLYILFTRLLNTNYKIIK